MIRRAGWVALVAGAVAAAVVVGRSGAESPPANEVPTVVEVPAGASSSSAVVVTAVTDGDTIEVVADGRAETVRILGINAPESGECLGTEATERVEDLLGRAATVRLAETAPRRDRYGRLLSDVLADDVSVAGVLVREGLALSVAYGRSDVEQAPLDRLQDLAQRDAAGLWSPSACGGSPSADVAISYIRFDAPGDDGQNPNGEWIAIEAGSEIDLTGWSIRDESSSHRYHFPRGFVLGAGQTVIVHSGCGVDRPLELFWCNTGSGIWNNDGDTGFLLDPSGSFVDTWAY